MASATTSTDAVTRDDVQHGSSASVAAVPTSVRLWGLDWRSVLPWSFDDVIVEAGTFAEATPFVEEHYAPIFRAAGADTRFLGDPMTPAKRRFSDAMDVFLMRHEGRVVGTLMAHPLDWSSYYMRSVAILPAHRDRRVLTRLVEAMYAPLRAAGVERMEGEISPTNLPMMRMLVGLGWVVNATVNSERWGTMVRLVKFLHEDAEATFSERFCAMRVRPRGSRTPVTNPDPERRTS